MKISNINKTVQKEISPNKTLAWLNLKRAHFYLTMMVSDVNFIQAFIKKKCTMILLESKLQKKKKWTSFGYPLDITAVD